MKPRTISPVWTWFVLGCALAFIGITLALILSASRQHREIDSNVELMRQLSTVEHAMRQLERRLSSNDFHTSGQYENARRSLLATAGARNNGNYPDVRLDSLIRHMDNLYSEVLLNNAGRGGALAGHTDFVALVNAAMTEVAGKNTQIHAQLASLSGDVAGTWRTITTVIVIVCMLGIFAAVLQSMHHSADIYDRSEQHYRALFRNSSDLIFILAPNGVIRYSSPSSSRILGFDPNELISKPIYDFLHADDADRLHRFYSTHLQRPGEIEMAEFRCRHRDGSTVYVEAFVNNLLEEESIRGIVMNARDVSERKRSEEALLLRDRAVQATDNGVFIAEATNGPSPIIYCNPALERMTGFSQREIIEEDALFKNDEKHGGAVNEQVAKALRRSRETHIVSRAHRKDGSEYWTEISISPIKNESGEITHFVGIQNDISEKKQAEEDRTKFVSLVEHSSDLISMATLDGRVLYLNNAGRTMTGIDRSEKQVALSVYDLFGDEMAHALGEEILPALREDGRWEGEGKLVNQQTGAILEVAINMFVVLHPQTGRPMCLAIVQRDISDRNRAISQLIVAKEKAEELAKLKSAFLTNMSHEIRTPLTGILGFASVLIDVVPEEEKEYVQLIEASGRRLLDTLNSVLDFARLEAGGIDINPVTLDVSTEILQSIRILQPIAEQKGLSLEVNLPPEPVSGVVDRLFLGQIITNLVSNAIKFTETGSVTVTVSSGDANLRIAVEDTGVGISEEFIPHLFEDFKQESMGISRSHEGSGLGLAITKRLLDLLGGSISVKSHRGVGSVFVVKIPLNRPVRATTEPSSIAPSSQNRAIVISSDEKTHMLLRHMMKPSFEVVEMTTAEEARLHLLEVDCDAILYDADMHAETESLAQLREVARGRSIPIIALTGQTSGGDGEQVHQPQFDACVAKPIMKQPLIDAINSAVRIT